MVVTPIHDRYVHWQMGKPFSRVDSTETASNNYDTLPRAVSRNPRGRMGETVLDFFFWCYRHRSRRPRSALSTSSCQMRLPTQSFAMIYGRLESTAVANPWVPTESAILV